MRQSVEMENINSSYVASTVACAPLGRFTLRPVSLERFVSLIMASAEGETKF